jgi:threonine/homoserine/homoserine lactone efflux protein
MNLINGLLLSTAILFLAVMVTGLGYVLLSAIGLLRARPSRADRERAANALFVARIARAVLSEATPKPRAE